MQICNGNIADNVDNADNADKADDTTKHTENTMKIINTQTENGSQAGKVPQAGKTAQADITQADSTAPTDSAAQKNAAQTDSAKAQQKNTAQKNAAQPETSLSRSLTDRHILLIALGGAIGTGLFYGSGRVDFADWSVDSACLPARRSDYFPDCPRAGRNERARAAFGRIQLVRVKILEQARRLYFGLELLV